MLTMSTDFSNAIDASVRRIKTKVELYEGSTLVTTYTQNDAVKSIDIERVGEDSKFFGFGVTHKANIKLIDVTRAINITTAHSFKISVGAVLPNGTIEYYAFPKMYVTEVNRDENTNELSITTYDVLNKALEYTVADLNLVSPYTIRDFVEACGTILGVPVSIPASLTEFDLEYPDGANFEGTERIRDGLTAAAEATQTIYFANAADSLVFKRLDISGDAVKTISKEEYITLDSGANRRLQTICSATELGDNVSASTTQIGTAQYVRDNPFWELRTDIATLVDNALAAMGGMTINQFNCEWRGNPAIEIGDKLSFVTKDDKVVTSYLLNDTLSYDGGLAQKSEWSYTESECTESNPTSLGEALKQTYAKVDKANKEISLLASEVSANEEAISSLKFNTDSIAASVSKMETVNTEALETINSNINTLTQKVEATVTAEDVKLEVQSQMANGTDRVTTSTGFTFNDEGLSVQKTGSEMKTTITEDGMTVYRDDTAMLTANNQGVIAYNLHAKTFLIVGETSRFEDYEESGEARTGCFWIG